jgi:hypothetical protein
MPIYLVSLHFWICIKISKSMALVSRMLGYHMQDPIPVSILGKFREVEEKQA